MLKINPKYRFISLPDYKAILVISYYFQCGRQQKSHKKDLLQCGMFFNFGKGKASTKKPAFPITLDKTTKHLCIFHNLIPFCFLYGFALQTQLQ